MEFTSDELNRFWNYVEKAKELDSCWYWKKSHQPSGYGQFAVIRNGKTETITTHRIAWMLTNGEIPKGLFVCHKCDNRGCCNPDHLFLGTHKDNMKDMYAKKRGTGRNGYVTNAKLIPDDVRRIRNEMSNSSLEEIATEFGITKAAASYVRLGKTWAWVL